MIRNYGVHVYRVIRKKKKEELSACINRARGGQT